MILHENALIVLCTVIAIVSVFGRSHSGQGGGAYRKSRTDPTTPRYMVELYERYKNGQTSFLQKTSTTVRSILPMKGKMEGGEMLVYNLTGVPRSEVIVRAELHAHIRRRKSKTHSYLLKLWDLMMTSSPPIEQREISGEMGWTVLDVTDTILKCRTDKGENQYLLGISVQSTKEGKKLRPLPMRRLVGSNPQPFLVLFSNEKSSGNSNTTDTFQSRLDDILNKYVQSSRKKRSVHDNKLPEHPVYQVNSVKLVPSSGGYGEKSKPSRFLPAVNSTGGKKQRGKKDKRKRKHRKLPFLRGKWTTPHENDATIIDDSELGIGTCQKKKLVVDFAEIGWTEWIISPKYFEADYCSGQCPFPLAKSLLPSNHATLQSLVHALNLDPNVPPPCCVPEVTSSLTLLYFDDDSNVVLKNYPNMVVESCACR